MRVGVKYCGGCHSMYDRQKKLEEIVSLTTGCTFEYVRQDESYDAVLLINGCFTQCAVPPLNHKGAAIKVTYNTTAAEAAYKLSKSESTGESR